MTKDEAIEIFEGISELEGISIFYQSGGKAGKLTIYGIKEASKIAISALRAQQAHAKLDRSRWDGCDNCTAGDGEFRCLLEKWGDGDYCSRCGRPLTEEAWAELERRINGGTTD